MKIEKIEVFHMDIPLNPKDVRRITFLGDIMKMDVALDVVVKVHADGIWGIGMTSTVGPYLGAVQDSVSAAVKYLAEPLIGLNPFSIEHINNVMDWSLRGHEPAKCTIDMALYDLVGKMIGRPVYDLLGGKKRDSFLSTISIATRSPEEMQEWAKQRYDEGFRALEVHLGEKAGTGFKRDVERIKAIREVVPDVVIVGDVHRNWNVKEAILATEELEQYDMIIEQPCDGRKALAELKKRTRLLIGADEDCHTVKDLIDLMQDDAVDYITIKPMKAGGLTKSKRMAVIAETMGILVRVDGIPGESLLSNGASAHLTMTLNNPLACGVMQNRRLSKELVAKGGMYFKDGEVFLPELPGLGVLEINEDVLELLYEVT